MFRMFYRVITRENGQKMVQKPFKMVQKPFKMVQKSFKKGQH